MRSSRFLGMALLGALWLMGAAPASASWPPPDSSGAAVAVSAFVQTNSSVSSDGAHGAFVAWLEPRSGSNRAAILAQHMTPLGDPLWTPAGRVLCADFVASDQQVMALTDGAGGAIVVWRDFRADTAGNLYAQRVAADGTPLWGATGAPVCSGPLHELYFSAVSDGAGGAYVGWRDDRNTPFEARAQHLDGSGARSWDANGVVLGSMSGIPVAASDEAGGFLMAWILAGSNECRVQRLSSAGEALWPAGGVLACTSPGYAWPAGLAGDALGGAYVLLSDQRPGQLYTQCYAQHVDASGAITYAAAGANLSGMTLPSDVPVVLADGAHGAIFGWRRYLNDGTGNLELRAARATPAGVESPTGGVLVGTSTDWWGSWFSLAATSDGEGGAVFVWNGTKQGNTDFPVSAQRVNASLQRRWTPVEGVTIARPLGVSHFVRAVGNGAHGAIAVWVWRPLATWAAELRAQLVGGDGGVAIAGVPHDAVPGRGRFAAAPSIAGAGQRVTFWASLDHAGAARVTLFDATGRRVRTLSSAAGTHLVRCEWDARDAGGVRVPPGVYLARLESGSMRAATRVVITN